MSLGCQGAARNLPNASWASLLLSGGIWLSVLVLAGIEPDRNPSNVRLGPPFIGQGDTTGGWFACLTPTLTRVAVEESWHQEEEGRQHASELSYMRLQATGLKGWYV
jgi:hypothetical protein